MKTQALRLLLLEDSAEDADLLRKMLRASKRIRCLVDHVERLETAIERCRAGGPRAYDVVLVDFHLPDSQGLATFERLHEAAPRLPVIVLTNLEDDSTATWAVRLGA